MGRTARRTIHGIEDLGPLAARAGLGDLGGAADPVDVRHVRHPLLRAAQPSARFINVGRGASVVEADLVSALERRWLAGAALDVFGDEPLGEDSPLWDVPGLQVFPHLSGDTVGWRDRLGEQFVAMYELWADGGPLPNVVDKQRGYVPSTDNSAEEEGTSPE
ncbi:D-2-hydroxyacid dehydrogenase OS=Streptomyces cyaneofuscatus OX=66883 GN=G3I52_06975 PE=4 SV=1 [Streptomyces cyaneofuscatus]